MSSGSMGEGKWGRTGKSRDRRDWCWDVLYERRLNKKKKEIRDIQIFSLFLTMRLHSKSQVWL